MEAAFDHGYGGSSEGGYAELALDVRIWAPFGLGLAIRGGLASNGFSNAVGVDLGPGLRVDLAGGALGGAQLFFVAGAAYAYGPFQGWTHAVGAFASLGFDLWHRNFFVGIAGTAHVLAARRDDPLWTLLPTIRIGGEWGL